MKIALALLVLLAACGGSVDEPSPGRADVELDAATDGQADVGLDCVQTNPTHDTCHGK
jgi:hypothetical protein